VLAAGLGQVLRLDPDGIRLVVAGRTDAGVHATGQVCHLDIPSSAWTGLPWHRRSDPPADPAVALLRRLAGVLPPDLRVHAAAAAPPGFDARFSAIHRRYAYRICDDEAGVPPLRRRDVLGHPRPADRRLDVDAMTRAAAGLLGLRDFAAFCHRRDGATTVRTLLEFGWTRDADGFATARVVADAFCHSMVRSLVGALLVVGEGRQGPEWPAAVLATGAREPRVNIVPAHGLTLEAVGYPPDAELADRARAARTTRRLPASPT